MPLCSALSPDQTTSHITSHQGLCPPAAPSPRHPLFLAHQLPSTSLRSLLSVAVISSALSLCLIPSPAYVSLCAQASPFLSAGCPPTFSASLLGLYLSVGISHSPTLPRSSWLVGKAEQRKGQCILQFKEGLF